MPIYPVDRTFAADEELTVADVNAILRVTRDFQRTMITGGDGRRAHHDDNGKHTPTILVPKGVAIVSFSGGAYSVVKSDGMAVKAPAVAATGRRKIELATALLHKDDWHVVGWGLVEGDTLPRIVVEDAGSGAMAKSNLETDIRIYDAASGNPVDASFIAFAYGAKA